MRSRVSQSRPILHQSLDWSRVPPRIIQGSTLDQSKLTKLLKKWCLRTYQLKNTWTRKCYTSVFLYIYTYVSKIMHATIYKYVVFIHRSQALKSRKTCLLNNFDSAFWLLQSTSKHMKNRLFSSLTVLSRQFFKWIQKSIPPMFWEACHICVRGSFCWVHMPHKV